MISIKKVEGRRDLYAFIRFNYHLYKGNAYAVPDFLEDMQDTFNRRKNAAFEFCEADLFLAYKDKKLVGRVAAIINHKANKTWQTKNLRLPEMVMSLPPTTRMPYQISSWRRGPHLAEA